VCAQKAAYEYMEKNQDEWIDVGRRLFGFDPKVTRASMVNVGIGWELSDEYVASFKAMGKALHELTIIERESDYSAMIDQRFSKTAKAGGCNSGPSGRRGGRLPDGVQPRSAALPRPPGAGPRAAGRARRRLTPRGRARLSPAAAHAVAVEGRDDGLRLHPRQPELARRLRLQRQLPPPRVRQHAARTRARSSSSTPSR
jgi:hypothetical protein